MASEHKLTPQNQILLKIEFVKLVSFGCCFICPRFLPEQSNASTLNAKEQHIFYDVKFLRIFLALY